ncbi:MAG: hypothetical protein ACI35T_07535 [Alistipes sp.]
MKKNKADRLEGNTPTDIPDVLFRDPTTQRNIFWATKDYEQWRTWSKDGAKRNKKTNGKLLQGKIIQICPM